MSETRTLSIEELRRIVERTSHLAYVAERDYRISDQHAPARVMDHYLAAILRAIHALERALNPEKLAYCDPQRLELAANGWSEEVFRELFELRAVLDELMERSRLLPLSN